MAVAVAVATSRWFFFQLSGRAPWDSVAEPGVDTLRAGKWALKTAINITNRVPAGSSFPETNEGRFAQCWVPVLVQPDTGSSLSTCHCLTTSRPHVRAYV